MHGLHCVCELLPTDPELPAARIIRNSAKGCIFLDGNLCTIYDARPKTCRDFPHVALEDHSLGSGVSSFARWAAICPIIFNALESYKHLTGFDKRPRRNIT
jgi:hypothetical protein